MLFLCQPVPYVARLSARWYAAVVAISQHVGLLTMLAGQEGCHQCTVPGGGTQRLGELDSRCGGGRCVLCLQPESLRVASLVPHTLPAIRSLPPPHRKTPIAHLECRMLFLAVHR